MDEHRRKQTGAAGDAWTVGVQWWRRFGPERIQRGMDALARRRTLPLFG
jgi:hypothetical protein